MKDNMFQPSCGHHQVSQVEIQSHMRIMHLYGTCYKSRFAKNLLEEDHSFDTMENIMEIIQFARKGRMMDALEKFHIYDITRKGVQINDRLTIQRNPIFDAVLRNRQHTEDR